MMRVSVISLKLMFVEEFLVVIVDMIRYTSKFEGYSEPSRAAVVVVVEELLVRLLQEVVKKGVWSQNVFDLVNSRLLMFISKNKVFKKEI